MDFKLYQFREDTKVYIYIYIDDTPTLKNSNN